MEELADIRGDNAVWQGHGEKLHRFGSAPRIADGPQAKIGILGERELPLRLELFGEGQAVDRGDDVRGCGAGFGRGFTAEKRKPLCVRRVGA